MLTFRIAPVPEFLKTTKEIPGCSIVDDNGTTSWIGSAFVVLSETDQSFAGYKTTRIYIKTYPKIIV